MPIRRTTPARLHRALTHTQMVRLYCWPLDADFVDDALLGFAFPSRRAAARAWPSCRADVWRGSRRMTIPFAARVFDHLTHGGWGVAWTSWNHVTYPVRRTVQALAADRAALARFEQRDPRGAASIAAFLAELREDFDTIEAIAHRLAETPHEHRRLPRPLMPSRRYGDPGPAGCGAPDGGD